MEKTPYQSWKINNLPVGCRYCVQGKKTVLFITGICSKHCFYCPISNEKWQQDNIYANEWKTKEFSEVLKEIDMCSSEGVGITGGDPLTKVERCCEYIKKLKQQYGKRFHIHLYTPLDLVTEEKLKMLYEAGLDEIRFNPDLEESKKETWKKIILATKFDWNIGIEIPVIPDYESITKELIDFVYQHVDFINLNELEMSDTNCSSLGERGYTTKSDVSYAVQGSEELAKTLLEYIDTKIKNKDKRDKKEQIMIHYCTASLKDNVQLRNRIKLRAKNYATKYDKITEDNTLLRNVLYDDSLKPGFEYEKKLQAITIEERKLLQEKLEKICAKVQGIMDYDKLRVIIRKDMIKIAKKIQGCSVAEIEEYPTKDGMLLSVEFL